MSEFKDLLSCANTRRPRHGVTGVGVRLEMLRKCSAFGGLLG